VSTRKRSKESRAAYLLTPYGRKKPITPEEARLQVAFEQAEIISDNPLTIRSLWSPLFEDERAYQEGRFATGFTHAAWNGHSAGPGVVRCKPPAGRFSEDYRRLQSLLHEGPVKRGA